MLENTYVPLHRIIPFSNVEGQGNRTSIFLQGCKLNCLYCHNPETIPRNTDEAKLVSLQYLYEQVKGAMPFIRGVTFSGGEPTIHHHKLVPLIKAIRELGLTCYFDTSGFFEYKATQELIAVTDKFLFDIKGEGLGLQTLCFDHKNKAGNVPEIIIPVEQTLKESNLNRNFYNLEKLLPQDKIEEVRLVVVNDFFDAEAIIAHLAKLLIPYPNVILKLIAMHSRGSRDPEALSLFTPSADKMDKLETYAKSLNITRVVKIY